MGNNDAKEMLAVCRKEAVKIEAELKHLREVAELHEIATENAARYAAVIERAPHGEYCKPWREADDPVRCTCWKASADTDAALREVRAKAWDEAAEVHRKGIATSGWHQWPANPYREAETDGQGGDD